MEVVVDHAEAARLGVLGAVLPVVAGQVGGDDQVQAQVQGVDADSRPTNEGLLEVDVPAQRLAGGGVLEAVHGEPLAGQEVRQQGGAGPAVAVQGPGAGCQVGQHPLALGLVAGAGGGDPLCRGQALDPRPVGQGEHVAGVGDHPLRHGGPHPPGVDVADHRSAAGCEPGWRGLLGGGGHGRVPVVHEGSCQVVRTTRPPSERCSLDQVRQHPPAPRRRAGAGGIWVRDGPAAAAGWRRRLRCLVGVVMRRLCPPRPSDEPGHHPNGVARPVLTGH